MNIVSLNSWKKIFYEIEIEEGKRFRSGDGLDLFDSKGRLHGQLEAIFAAGDDIRFAGLDGAILVIPIWEQNFYVSICLIIDQCKVAVLISAKVEMNLFSDAIPFLVGPDIYVETRSVLFQLGNSGQGISGNGFLGFYLCLPGGTTK